MQQPFVKNCGHYFSMPKRRPRAFLENCWRTPRRNWRRVNSSSDDIIIIIIVECHLCARGGGDESNSRVMNPMVREASRRAEAARQAFANAPPPPARRQDPTTCSAQLVRNPVPVSPPRAVERPFEPRPPPSSSSS